MNATSNEINPLITNSIFYKNVNGLSLSGNITSLVQNNELTDNQFGLTASVTSRPTITSNNFARNTRLPIYLVGSISPTFDGNNFVGYPDTDQRLGIGLSGSFTLSDTWVIVDNMPYVVLGNTTIAINSVITLPQNLTLKFDSSMYLDAKGGLILLSDLSNPIIFTSFKEDTAGDTNGDRSNTQPAPGDWKTIYLENDSTIFASSSVRYAVSGLTIYNASSDTYNPIINNNSFSFNLTGVYYRSCTDGVNRGELIDNSITNSAGFPIVLNGTAFPNYVNNTFSDNLNPGIALTGDWFTNGTWPDVVGDQNQVFPYVVITEKKCDNQTDIGGLRITSGYEITATTGTVFKLDNSWIDVLGTLTMQSTYDNPIIFTSFKDDSFKGDTNGDGNDTQPVPGDWDAIYLKTSTTNFHNGIVKYANHGVHVNNSTLIDLAPPIQDSVLEENNYGIVLQTNNLGNITSEINNNQFINNYYGLVTYLNTNSTFFPLIGGAFPLLTNNRFSGSTAFPIFLNGTAEPIYYNNIFTDNTHPSIALGGFWNGDVTWVQVVGDNEQIFPYVVVQNIYEDRGFDPFSPVKITFPEGLIVKFDLDTYIYAYGLLDLQSTPANPIVFTSYYDDSYAGDTNADGGTISPGLADWKTIWLFDSVDKRNEIHDIIAKHATAAIGVYYDGPVNTQINTIIRDSTFSENHVGVVLAIGWEDPIICVPCQGEGNIISPITNVNFDDNLFGMVTYAHKNSTGYSSPTLNNVTFNRTLEYSIYLGGTSFPIFESRNVISESPKEGLSATGYAITSNPEASPISLDISFIETPGIQAQRAANKVASILHPVYSQPTEQYFGGLTVVNSLSPAIGLGGIFNNTGTLYQADNVTYAVTGNFPLIISIRGNTDPVNPNLFIGLQNPQGSAVTLLPNTVVKMGPGLYIIVYGNLNMQGTLEQPVIFTSINDDTVGGDTNRDGGANQPAKGDWYTLALESSYTNFTNAVLKYSSSGLFIYFNGNLNENINPMVSGSIFANNSAGITLWTPGAGDILSEIHHNLFINNDNDILGHLNVSENGQPSAGRLMVSIHDNDLIGQTYFGVNNLSTNWTIQAQNDYWGDPSGPQHSSNPDGEGVPVSDHVNFSPWLTIPSWTMTYSIQGRVISNDDIPVGISGVEVILSNGMKTVTDSSGYFNFYNLNAGDYTVEAVLAGYNFIPQSYALSIPPDAFVLFTRGFSSQTYLPLVRR